MIKLAEESNSRVRIKTVGVGGGGCNAVNTMIQSGLEDVEFIAANTDVQCLENNLAPVKVQLGPTLTRGLGAGANPETGKNAAMEVEDHLREMFAETDMVFVTAGMGGGTGTGAAPIVAGAARAAGALTVGVVTKPFDFEGRRRYRQAVEGVARLKEAVDSLIVIPNQRLVMLAGEQLSTLFAFKKVDEVLYNAVRGVTELLNGHGYINLDFADVKAVMNYQGLALMGVGVGSGPNKAIDSARMAVSSPLLEDVTIDGATGAIVNVTCGLDMPLTEVTKAVSCIEEAAHADANIIFGLVFDARMKDECKITVIATGFDRPQTARRDSSVVRGAENLDIPAFARQKTDTRIQPQAAQDDRSPEKYAQVLKELTDRGFPAENERDIPAFIRKRMEGGG
jgi:cell division protein FtsZ